MTTKDQAIAPTHAELMELFYQMNGSEGLQKLRAFNKFDKAIKQVCERPAAPDCRTCLHGRQGDGIWQCDKCVMGDQYQPAPVVVLWRTE